MIQSNLIFVYFFLLNMNVLLEALTCPNGTVANGLNCECKFKFNFFFIGWLNIFIFKLTQLTLKLVVRHFSIKMKESLAEKVKYNLLYENSFFSNISQIY